MSPISPTPFNQGQVPIQPPVKTGEVQDVRPPLTPSQFMQIYNQALYELQSISTVSSANPVQISFTTQQIQNIADSLNSDNTYKPGSAFAKLCDVISKFSQLAYYPPTSGLTPPMPANMQSLVNNLMNLSNDYMSGNRTQSFTNSTMQQFEETFNGTSPYSGLLNYESTVDAFAHLSDSIVSPFGEPLWNWAQINQHYQPVILELQAIGQYASVGGNTNLANTCSQAIALFDELGDPANSHNIPNIQTQLSNLLPTILSGMKSIAQ